MDNVSIYVALKRQCRQNRIPSGMHIKRTVDPRKEKLTGLQAESRYALWPIAPWVHGPWYDKWYARWQSSHRRIQVSMPVLVQPCKGIHYVMLHNVQQQPWKAWYRIRQGHPVIDVKGNTNLFGGDTEQLACPVDSSERDSNILLLQELLCNFI